MVDDIDHHTLAGAREDGVPARPGEQRHGEQVHGDTAGFRRGRRKGEIMTDGVSARSAENGEMAADTSRIVPNA